MAVFFDYAKIFVAAGKGGDGMVAFRREKYVPDGGPAGGDGGRGGSVIFKVDEGLRTLLDFRYHRHFKAKSGENGMSKSKYGRGADDLYVAVPPGTIVRNAQTKEKLGDLLEQGEELVVAKGGRGGRGNIRFATHKNPAPDIAENGEPGESFELELELKILADVGLVGFPSVGKSTLLASLTSAKPKIADYPFTTLAPQLGMVHVGDGESFVLADLPGLIEGASSGVGLGIQFLKHVERTRVLWHVIDFECLDDSRTPYQDFKAIQKELEAYHLRLLERPMLIVANKMDAEGAAERLATFQAQLAADSSLSATYQIFPVSSLQREGLKELVYATQALLDTTEFFPLEEEQVSDEVHYTPGAQETKDFTITRDDQANWIITGEKLARLVKMTNFEFEESIMRFSRQLRGMGIDDALRERGAKDGDMVNIEGFEFQFVE